MGEVNQMQTTTSGPLVVAISSRALFDCEEENRIFEEHNDRAYMQLQLQRLAVQCTQPFPSQHVPWQRAQPPTPAPQC